jgi:hypothetical protein
MTTGHVLTIIAGLCWATTGGILFEIFRLLGPEFDKAKTVHWFWRRITWLGGAGAMIGGVFLLFPGDLVDVSRISVLAPVRALIALGLAAALLDWVMRDRAPPPWSENMLRLAGVLGMDGPVKFAALNVPPAAVGDVAPADEPLRHRRSRLPILMSAVAVVVSIAVFVALNAPGASQ